MNEFENRIYGVESCTLLDFPNNIAAIFFYGGCNLRCPYCYNPTIVRQQEIPLSSQGIKEFLNRRNGKLTGVVFSGGECTIHGKKLISDVEYVKSLGYKVKIDTNGTNPEVLRELITKNLVDYVALDYKCASTKTTLFSMSDHQYFNFIVTIDLLKKSGIPYEVRTTVHTDVINEDNVNDMLEHLQIYGYRGTYYIQHFLKTGTPTLLDVDQNPRSFNVSRLKVPEGIKIEVRNIEDA